MDIEFDAAKDAANIDKHGVSLERFIDMDIACIVEDHRFEEPRLRVYGRIYGVWHCGAVTRRGDAFRIISLRRAHSKEIRRHV